MQLQPLRKLSVVSASLPRITRNYLLCDRIDLTLRNLFDQDLAISFWSQEEKSLVEVIFSKVIGANLKRHYAKLSMLT